MTNARTKPRTIWTADNCRAEDHFFASSIGYWNVSSNLDELIKKMKSDKLDFSVWHVPLPHDAEYEIDMLAPKVEGAKRLTTIRYEEAS